jgi:hypothetical protein
MTVEQSEKEKQSSVQKAAETARHRGHAVEKEN